MEYNFLIIFFALLINSFCIGKLIEVKFSNLNGLYSSFLGFILLIVTVSIACIPFYIVANLSQYFSYLLICLQIIAIIFYLLNYKKYYICLYLDNFKTISFFMSFFVCLSCYFLFFFNKLDFSFLQYNRPINFIDVENINNSYISFFNNAIFNLFITFKLSINEFYSFYNYAFPIVLMLLISCLVCKYFSINSYKDFKNYFFTIFSSYFISFFCFDINDFSINLMNNSLAILILTNAIIIFFKLNQSYDYEINGFILNASFFYLACLNLSFIYIVVFLWLFFCVYLISKKINFGCDFILKSFGYIIAIFALFFLSYYSVTNGITIFYSLICMIIFVIYFLFFVVYRKNNLDKKYPFIIQKYTMLCWKYFKYILILFFIVFSLMVIFLIIIANNEKGLWFFKDYFANNINNQYKNIAFVMFNIFYWSILLISIVCLIINFKKINEIKNNTILIFLLIFIGFNPFTLIFIDAIKMFYSKDYYSYLDLWYQFELIIFSIFIIYKAKLVNFKNSNKFSIFYINKHFKKQHFIDILTYLYSSSFIFCTLFLYLI